MTIVAHRALDADGYGRSEVVLSEIVETSRVLCTLRAGGTLTPALSHRMHRKGEGEPSSVGRRNQPLGKLRVALPAVPSPVGRERVRVRAILLEIRLLFGISAFVFAQPFTFKSRGRIGCGLGLVSTGLDSFY